MISVKTLEPAAGAMRRGRSGRSMRNVNLGSSARGSMKATRRHHARCMPRCRSPRTARARRRLPQGHSRRMAGGAAHNTAHAPYRPVPSGSRYHSARNSGDHRRRRVRRSCWPCVTPPESPACPTARHAKSSRQNSAFQRPLVPRPLCPKTLDPRLGAKPPYRSVRASSSGVPSAFGHWPRRRQVFEVNVSRLAAASLALRREPGRGAVA